jgi:short-subunit dehydrogenase
MRAPRRIFITGASSGIGYALALRYAAPGVELVLLGRDAGRLADVDAACSAKGALVETTAVDVQDRDAMRAAVEQAFAKAPLDLLVANAGVATGLSPGQILESPDAVRATFAINVIGVFNTVEPAITSMCAQKRGQIAIVGSMAGVRGLPHSPAYSAAKSAVHVYAEGLRGVLTPHGVDVALIVPGYVKTPMSARTIVKTPWDVGVSAANAKSWQPGAVSAEKFADIVAQGLARRKAVIAFPLYMYWALRVIAAAPPRLVDRIMRLFPAIVPETREREREGA